MFADDSVWCCLLPTYCSAAARPPAVSTRYLNGRWKETLTVSGFVFVICTAIYCAFKKRSRKRVKRKTSEQPCVGDKARFKGFAEDRSKDWTRANDKCGACKTFTSSSLTKMKRLIRHVACQTTGYGSDRGFRQNGSRPTTAGTRNRGPNLTVVGSGSGSLTEIQKAVDDFMQVTEQQHRQMQSGEPISDAAAGLTVPADGNPVEPSSPSPSPQQQQQQQQPPPPSIPVQLSDDSIDASPQKAHSTLQ